MKADKLFEALSDVAASLGVVVRVEVIGKNSIGQPKGGLCLLNGEPEVIIHRRLTDSEKTQVLIDALAGFDLGGVYMQPEIREILETALPDMLKAG